MTPYQLEAPPPRQGVSTGLKVLGIIQIVFGAIGLLGAPIGLAVAMLNAASKDPVQRRLHELMWEGTMGIWSYGSQALGFVFAIALLAGGIGIVRGKRWGRTASFVYSIGSLVSLLVGQVLMGIVVYPELLDMMDKATSPVERAGAMGGLIGGLGAAGFGMILPLIVLIVMARGKTREQPT